MGSGLASGAWQALSVTGSPIIKQVRISNGGCGSRLSSAWRRSLLVSGLDLPVIGRDIGEWIGFRYECAAGGCDTDGQKAWLERLLQIDRRLLIAVALPAAFGVGVLDWLDRAAGGAGGGVPVSRWCCCRWWRRGIRYCCCPWRARWRGGTFSVHYSLLDFLLRFLLAFAAFAATGLLISEILRHYAQTKGHLRELKEQQLLSQEMETHLRELADSSRRRFLRRMRRGGF